MTVQYEEYQKVVELNKNLVEQIQNLTKLLNEQESLRTENKNLKILVENMQLQINSLQKMVFGSKRESTPPSDIIEGTQCSIFENNNLNSIEKNEDFKQELKDSRKELMVYKKKDNRTRQAGIKRNIFKNVEIQVEEYILDDNENCSECGGMLKQIGRKIIHEEIAYVPAKLKIIQHVKGKMEV